MKNLNPEVRNGILLFLFIGVYFIIIDLLGYADNIYLRTLNIFFVFYFVNRTYKQYVSKGESSFLNNLGAAIITSVLGVVLSIVGFLLYIVVFRGNEYLSELSEPLIGAGKDLTLLQYCFALFAEGIASSVIVAFILNQYWKNKSTEN